MARGEQPLVTRSWTTEETILPFLQGSYSVIAKQSQTLRDPRGDLWGVDVHCHRRRDAAGGGTVGLQALEFMDDLVEAPLCGGLPMDREREWRAISWSWRTLLTHIET
jgi:hypothetical protein